jgi:heme-degrading monooxygenase HmoA
MEVTQRIEGAVQAEQVLVNLRAAPAAGGATGARQRRDLDLDPDSAGTTEAQQSHRDRLTKEDLVIGRIWHGWTKPENADGYERLLKEEIFPGIARKNVPGYGGIQLFRGPTDDGEEVEFVTIMRFDSWEAVRRFSGEEDYERAYVPPEAREVLARFDERSRHYEVRESLEYGP